LPTNFHNVWLLGTYWHTEQEISNWMIYRVGQKKASPIIIAMTFLSHPVEDMANSIKMTLLQRQHHHIIIIIIIVIVTIVIIILLLLGC